MHRLGCALLGLMAFASVLRAGNSGIDPACEYAWGENVGWLDAAPSNNEMTVHFNGNFGWLTGYLWSENVGWIRLASETSGWHDNSTSNNWGVNMSPDGRLSGYAWGENIGWINFGDALCDASVNPTNGEFSGRAWGENVGWLSFKGSSPVFGVRTLAFDTQAQGTPNWWLDDHGVGESFDAGDGVPAWKKYVMDVDPSSCDNSLRITAITKASYARAISFWPASARRYYTLEQRQNLASGDWTEVSGQARVAGVGGAQTFHHADSSTQVFYRVSVSVSP